MSDLLKREEELRKEVDGILYEKGLYNLLENYGEVQLTGSYILKTMYKKDLDISIYNPDLSVTEFYELGGKLAELLEPHGVHYRNTRVKFVENRPLEALYWGMEFDEWKMDLWLITREHFDGALEYCGNIIKNMTDEKRKLILEIKNMASENYNRKYSSKELYAAIFKEDIKSIEEFNRYLQEKIGCEL